MHSLSKVLTFTIITTTLSYTMDPSTLSGQVLYEQNKSQLNVQLKKCINDFALFQRNVFKLNIGLKAFIYDFALWPKKEQNKVIPNDGGLYLGVDVALDYKYGDPGLNSRLAHWRVFGPGQYVPFTAAINYLKEQYCDTEPTDRYPQRSYQMIRLVALKDQNWCL